ncbi:MAG: DUF1592 domain-containing protein [Sandaracinaceae bacterium]
MRRHGALGLVALLVVGCETGATPYRPAPTERVPTPGSAREVSGLSPREAPACDGELGAPILRRLTSTQLRNTLEDVFDSPNVPLGDLVVDPSVDGYDVDARAAVIRDLDAERLMLGSETIARWAAYERVPALLSCTANTPVCRVGFVTWLGRRLYREPLDNETFLAYDAMFDRDGTFAEGAEVVIRTMLQSPRFLYRSELGEPDPDAPGLVQLTRWELATELAFYLTNSAPDDELLDAAGAGRLRTDEDLDREAERLLATDRGAEALARFAREWLGTDRLAGRPKDPRVTAFTEDVRASMVRETDTLFLDVVASGGGLSALFTSRHTFLDPTLAAFYGVPPDGIGALVRIDTADAGRAPGVLGHGSVLATYARADTSSPTQRGLLVRRRLLCESIPSPPPGIDTSLAPRPDARTTRERYEAHLVDDTCVGCHRRVDPIGFALERYDGFGRARETEAGLPIDDTGTILGTPRGDLAIEGVDDLARFLARSPEAHACFRDQLSYYAFGTEGCLYPEATDGLDGDTPLIDLIGGVVHARNFRFRAMPTAP